MNKPATLFKYQDISVQTLSNLREQIIYCGSTTNFNDPFDCGIIGGINKAATVEQLETVRDWHLLKNPMLTPENRNRLKNESIESLRPLLVDVTLIMMRLANNDFRKKFGVSCFSKKSDNLLMWSHYANQHKGFCLEFDTNVSLFDKVRKVLYKPKFSLFDLDTLYMEEELQEDYLNLFCTKSKDWAYEKEWRLIAPIGKVFYPKGCLKHIYFGPRVDTNSIKLVQEITKNISPDTKMLTGSISPSQFKVDFKPLS